MDDANRSPIKDESSLRPLTNSQDFPDRFGSVAPLRSIRSAKRRSLRNRTPKPPPGLTLGMVKNMVGFWEEKVEEIKGAPCGCGREQCPVNSVGCEARRRWKSAVERIADDLTASEKHYLVKHQRAESVSTDMGSSIGELIDEVGSINISLGLDRSVGGTESEVSVEAPHDISHLGGAETPSSINSINISGLVTGSDIDTIDQQVQSPMSVIGGGTEEE